MNIMKKRKGEKMEVFYKAISYLPDKIKNALMNFNQKNDVCEIRLRSDLPVSVTTFQKNFFINFQGQITSEKEAVRCNEKEMMFTVNRLCEGSIYRHINTIKEGYIITPCGLRVGICGEATYDCKQNLTDVIDIITSLNIRIPRKIDNASDGLIKFYKRNGLYPTLIFSSPGVGKTTLLRDLAIKISSFENYPYRVAVIDERKELFPSGSDFKLSAGLLDILSGYRKSLALENAIRSLNSQIIICDEIGAYDDTEAILNASLSGVKLIASTHCDSFAELNLKPNLKKLLKNNVFKFAVHLYKSFDSKVPAIDIREIKKE